MSKQKEKLSKELRKKEKKVGKPAVIFSFDGTIMNTEPAIFAAYRHVFAKFGGNRRFTAEEEQKVIGVSSGIMLKEFFPDLDQEELLKEYRTYQYYHLSDLIQPMPGVKDFLKWLKAEGYPVGIISSRARSTITSMLEHTGLMQYIDVIIAGSTKEKEFSGSEALRIAGNLLKRQCVIYIGHTAAHVLNGHLVGAFTIAYNPSGRILYDIIDAGPDFITADYKMVKRLLEGEPLWLAYELAEPLAPAEEAPVAAVKEQPSEEVSQEAPARKKRRTPKKAK
ncbi:MAG: HAD hydrolase-like protein [Solobacterium sp.]|nr:HAD hydrolase-like protein [Solobacterium sp.]